MFRNQIPDNYLQQFVVRLSEFLKSASPVNRSYASACIEKLLLRRTISTSPSQPIFTSDNVNSEMLGSLL